jgi:hypothetical protein
MFFMVSLLPEPYELYLRAFRLVCSANNKLRDEEGLG